VQACRAKCGFSLLNFCFLFTYQSDGFKKNLIYLKMENILVPLCVMLYFISTSYILSQPTVPSLKGGIYEVMGISLSNQYHYIAPKDESYGGPDNWAAANGMSALIEGLAGVKNARFGLRQCDCISALVECRC
jgi:hypothetical protein